MTLTLQQARDIVTAAVANGLIYDDTWPLNSTPEQFERTFRDFDQQLRLGNGLHACWLLDKRYRVSRFNNEIVEASTLLARDDTQGFLSLVEGVTESRLVYELTFFPLLDADPQRCFTWLERSPSERIAALSIAAAMCDRLFGNGEVTPEFRSILAGLADALRHKEPHERSRWWWQLAALSGLGSNARRWKDVGRLLWTTAATEIGADAEQVTAYVKQSESLRKHCPTLLALLATIADHGDQEFRRIASDAILSDFELRLQADEPEAPIKTIRRSGHVWRSSSNAARWAGVNGLFVMTSFQLNIALRVVARLREPVRCRPSAIRCRQARGARCPRLRL